MRLRDHFLLLQARLDAHRHYWAPSPFHASRPSWCTDHPGLTEAVLQLDDATVDLYRDDPAQAADWLSHHLPGLREILDLSELASLPSRSLPPTAARFEAEIPGRKLAQIEAFLAHLPPLPGPALEWCAGKAHLGRRLHRVDGITVNALEIDATLCAHAARLAVRQGVEQHILEVDALSADGIAHVRDRDVLALHACGELHRHLVRSAAVNGARSIHIAPCCYARGAGSSYRPLSQSATLVLDAGALRLAVTETVTAPLHDRRRLARDQAWKLGFIALCKSMDEGTAGTFRPIPGEWLKQDFQHFCTQLAAREGVALPAHIDWTRWESIGERRRSELLRLEIVRHAFRRPLEIWLALDIALGLDERGFDVEMGAFCARSLTPRNLLISARRRTNEKAP